MKLRIKGNLLRFRLGKSDVRSLAADGVVEEAVSFGPGQSEFCYRLERTSANEFSASFTDGRITVHVPADLVDQWSQSDAVEIEGSQTLADNTELNFLIEKDFYCLSSDEKDDGSDKYPNPRSGESC